MKNIIKHVFGLLASLVLLLSLLMGMLLFSALITGGDSAIWLTAISKQLSSFSIYIATTAVFSGLVYLYLNRTHTLVFSTNSK